ncbi:MAG: HAD-IIIC family phosphatase [Lachnospiraceae bacterium]|nr:HAD-IIIC family phosphatase [Lachnospiraceae bacterium]
MRELEYPFNSNDILKRARRLKRELLARGSGRLKKKIAVLGGSTTHDIIRAMELFLLDAGIEPEFYESEYAQYWQDAMFPGEKLSTFAPDIVLICTSVRNIRTWPQIGDSTEQIARLEEEEIARYTGMWDKLSADYHCPVIQNNFEDPSWRLMGNRDGWDSHGRVRYVRRLNERFAAYAEAHESFYLCDLAYIAASYGLDRWHDPLYWYMYKYAMGMEAIPYYAWNVAAIIRSLFGKNKKALVLDLDNTLWGGVVGDDGVENLEIGEETAVGEAYAEFQEYLRAQKEIGVLLTVDSKNDEENALAGLSHPDGRLKPEDFVCIKANWEPKSVNAAGIAQTLHILEDSLVFVDDNPAEREIVRQQLPGTAVPELPREPEQYLRILDRSAFFEVTNLTEDDRGRTQMMRANADREALKSTFADYGAYLRSLEMTARIHAFDPVHYARISQLTNKSNQFNLTTRRFTQDEIAALAEDEHSITLCGSLADRFGDNGIVSLVAGRVEGSECHITLWLMSCRVLKRGMEQAMMDALAAECAKRGVTKIFGYYYPTAKNGMVRDFYDERGFALIKSDEEGNTIWVLDPVGAYEPQNQFIRVTEGGEQ